MDPINIHLSCNEIILGEPDWCLLGLSDKDIRIIKIKEILKDDKEQNT